MYRRRWRQATARRWCSRLGAQKILHGAIFERVEADHGEPAARFQAIHRRVQAAIDRVEFAVDMDAQRLEAARRRMLVTFAPAERALDQLRKVEWARQRLLDAACNDGTPQAATLLLL